MKTQAVITLCLLVLYQFDMMSQGLNNTANQIDSLNNHIENLNESEINRAEARVHLIRLYIDNNRIIEAMDAINELKVLVENSSKSQVLVYYYKAMAHLHRHSRLVNVYQLRANWLSAAFSPLNRWGEVDNGLEIEGAQSDTSRAVIRAYENALDIFKDNEDDFSVRHLHTALAFMYRWWSTPGNMYIPGEDADQYEFHRNQALSYLSDDETLIRIHLLLQQLKDQWYQTKYDTREHEIELAELVVKITDPMERAIGYYELGQTYIYNNRVFLGMRYTLDAIRVLESINEVNLLSFCYYAIGNMYDRESAGKTELTEKIVDYAKKSLEVFDRAQAKGGIENVYILYAKASKKLGKAIPDSIASGLDDYINYLENNFQRRYNRQLYAFYLGNTADDLRKNGDHFEALGYDTEAMNLLLAMSDFRGAGHSALKIARYYYHTQKYGQALKYAIDSYNYSSQTTWFPALIPSAELVSELYEKLNRTDKVIEYLKIHKNLKDERERLNSQNQFAELEISALLEKNQEEIGRLEVQKSNVERENRNQQIVIALAGIILSIVVILSLVVYSNSLARKKTNEKLEEQKESLEKALQQLQSTQTQLIHSEKMASLGELTAGIAHEIQNPLNFVNNFSEVNKDLVDELEEEIKKGDKEEISALLNDIRENEGKVMHHGKRAEAIVKSMLQHSRGSEGTKEPTDINALCDEYLRLAYHGFRAKDQSFNADFKTEFDPDLPKVEVVPQDIGRVLLNLINNAFQAVSSQINRHSEPASPVGGLIEEYREKEYENNKNRSFASLRMTPLVTVSTKKLESNIQIKVTDNGPGIPDDIKDKIFQPFFTTKPTGEGTGLGLSMSYDIVTKGHGGTIKVLSGEGKGTEFVIELPLQIE